MSMDGAGSDLRNGIVLQFSPRTPSLKSNSQECESRSNLIARERDRKRLHRLVAFSFPHFWRASILSVLGGCTARILCGHPAGGLGSCAPRGSSFWPAA